MLDDIPAGDPRWLFPSAPEPDVDAALDTTVLAIAAEMLDDIPAGDPRWLFPSAPEPDVDAALDTTVLAIAAEMLDDIPAGDPRWLFPSAPEPDVDAALDTTVLAIAAEMLDDIPAGDPRWKSRAGGLRTRVSLGSSAALQQTHQLRDKQRAFTLFRDFLRAHGLLRRLQLVSTESGGGVQSTVWALCGLAEQLAIAAALRRLQHGPDAQLIDAAIYQVVCGDSGEVEEEPEVEAALASGALAPADACYRRVSRISRVLRALATLPHARATPDPRAHAAHVHASMNIINKRFNNTLPKDFKDAWRCALCKSNQPKLDNTNTPVRAAAEGVTLQRGAATKSPVQLDMSATEQSLTFMGNLNDTAHNITVEMSDYQIFAMELRSFKEEMREELRANRVQIQQLNETIASISKRVTESESRISKLEERMQVLEDSQPNDQTQKSLAASIEHLKAELNDRDQDLLLNDVEISCIPEQKEESLSHVVTVLASKLGVALCNQDIVSATRVGRKSESGEPPARPRPIVVRMARRALRDQLLQAARTVLGEAHKCRAAWAAEVCGAAPAPAPPLGPRALLPALVQMLRLALTQSAHNCPDPNVRWQLCETAGALADRLLSDAAPLRAPHTRHVHDKLSQDIIRPFMEEGLTERAAVLAEKFREWELLVELCVRAADLPRLYAYVDKYPSEGVAELAFAQIVDGGGPLVSALVRCERPNVASKLTAWLQASPTRAHLLALQRLTARDYSAAAPALAQLAGEEQDSVNRMTTMASLAKLCILASDEPENQPAETRRKVETCLALSDQHAALPRDIRLHYGLDAEDTKVIPPEEMIQMYIDAEGQNLTEYDYKKALDLTDYVPDIERRDDLRMKVWCASIVRDDWAACRVEAPADELQRRLFFRLIDLVHLMGGEVELVLPGAEELLAAPALSALAQDARFGYILKYGYECLAARDPPPAQA
ncbi:nuclear pore complex protein Nup133 [Ostrinia nubilalis]|uniref:nuclear pore complex protein Nup133 n=2 Tax=Ostrinia TaxID=29056 RepID=UPI0030823744